MPVAATALLVAVSCYLGSKVGLALRFPPATPSVMWPPNAILTATLLLAPPRRWPIYLLAALPAHLFLQPNVGWPVAMVTLLFATNCSEALAAAILVRRFSDAPTRFDTLARVAVFIGGAVLLAPFVSSFADAAVVATLRGEPYWLVWRMRFFSNTLTALTLVPAIVIVAKDGAAWMRGATARRILEAAALALGLLLVKWIVFAGAGEGFPAALGFLLPFFLWAAVRFGPAGASLSLLGTSVVAIVSGVRGLGPFRALPPAEGVFALQIFLTMGGLPIMCVAALMRSATPPSALSRNGCISRSSSPDSPAPSSTRRATRSIRPSRCGWDGWASSCGSMRWCCSASLQPSRTSPSRTPGERTPGRRLTWALRPPTSPGR